MQLMKLDIELTYATYATMQLDQLDIEITYATYATYASIYFLCKCRLGTIKDSYIVSTLGLIESL
jgi:hypothetical protein